MRHWARRSAGFSQAPCAARKAPPKKPKDRFNLQYVDKPKGFGMDPLLRQAILESDPRKADDVSKLTQASEGVLQSEEERLRLFKDRNYLPERYIGKLELEDNGLLSTWRATEEIKPYQVVMVSQAALFAPGSTPGTAPTVEDVLEQIEARPINPACRRAMACLTCSASNWQRKRASVQVLDVTRAAKEEAAPRFDKETLRALLQCNAHAEPAQDVVLHMLRQQKPCSCIGIWVEHALVEHSCVPNTAVLTVRDRMLLRTMDTIFEGEAITVNKLDQKNLMPLKVRQGALSAMGLPPCGCERCVAEAALPEEATAALERLHELGVQVNQEFVAAAAAAAVPAMRSIALRLQSAARELEALLARHVTDRQHRLWIQASAYIAYELLAFLACQIRSDSLRYEQQTLQLLGACHQGSDTHVLAVAEHLRKVFVQMEVERSPIRKRKLRRDLPDTAMAFACRYGEVPDTVFGDLLRASMVGGNRVDQESMPMTAEMAVGRASDLDVHLSAMGLDEGDEDEGDTEEEDDLAEAAFQGVVSEDLLKGIDEEVQRSML